MKARHVLLGCGIALIVLVVGSIALVSFLSHAVSKRLVMPPQAKNPGVVMNTAALSKSVLLTDPRLGDVTDIVEGKFDRARSTEIGIAGTMGVAFLNAAASPTAFTSFSGPQSRANIIDVESDGNCEFLDRGSWGGPAALLDHAGAVITEFPSSMGTNDVAPGDINGDGKLEFAAGYNGAGGVRLFDCQGKKLWSAREGNVWRVAMADTNSDGRLEVIHSDAGGQITVRDRTGRIISQKRPTDYFSYFSLCRWPDARSPQCCLQAAEGKVWLFAFDGSTVAEFTAPSCRQIGYPAGTSVQLQAGQPSHFAVVVNFTQWRRSILYVFDSSKKLVYEEVLAEPCQSVAAIKLGKTGAESLLVGGEGRVLRYDLAQGKP